jgi:hypothetical protein
MEVPPSALQPAVSVVDWPAIPFAHYRRNIDETEIA